MKMYQVSVKGQRPSGGYYKTTQEAQREIGFLRADDRRYAAEAMEQAGIEQAPWEYEIHEVDVVN